MKDDVWYCFVFSILAVFCFIMAEVVWRQTAAPTGSTGFFVGMGCLCLVFLNDVLRNW